MDAHNPFTGRTLRVLRPAQDQATYCGCSRAEVSAAQAQWDEAERIRIEELSRITMLEREVQAEEPASKAHENRLRVAFLSIRGNTMAMWATQRDTILAGGDPNMPTLA
jgi:hypothetical protein